MKEEGRQRFVLRESHIILKYARVRPVEGRVSWDPPKNGLIALWPSTNG